MMRFTAQVALLLLLLGLAGTTASGQEQRGRANAPIQAAHKEPGLPQKQLQARPLTLGDGLAILGAALDSRHRSGSPADCSHFVHELYQRAGFPYEYASSLDLYAGADEFRRVQRPQPGDLAVWRGHAGIVINPVQHSFFSLLSSGPGVDSYDSPYWTQRGRPRFLRYVKAVPSSVLSSSSRTASLKPAGLASTEPHAVVAEDAVADVSEESPGQTAASSKVEKIEPANTEAPHVVVNSLRPKPDQVRAAFLQACQNAEETLRGRDLFKLAQSLVVFDHFEVRKVHVIGNQGWAEVQTDQLASLAGNKADLHKRSQRQRWSLRRRDNENWELTTPANTIYLPQHVAERLLAHELAQLTEDNPAAPSTSKTQQKGELARLLNVLLEK